jgi:hypothetical protein
MSSSRTEHTSDLARAVATLALVLAGALSHAAFAQSADNPQKAGHSHSTAKSAAHNSKVLSGIERGTNAAGHGIESGASATRRGVDNTAERASAPVRRWGESLGRKITPHGASHTAAPSVGPQGSAP